MKRIVLAICLLILTVILVIFTSCGGDDNSNTPPPASGEFIEVTLDSNPILDFSQNILAQDNPLPQSSGFSNIFTIESNNGASSTFYFSSTPSNQTPFVTNVPSSETISGSVSNRLRIDGIDIDDAQSNNLTITYSAFGANTGDAITLNISGTIFEVGSTSSSALNVDIDILRD